MRVERELSTNTGIKVMLYIEMPHRSDRNDEFYCKIGLEGGGVQATEKIYGIDAMQALILGLRHLNGFVLRVSKSIAPNRLTWEFGAGDDDFGLSV
jgi:hypothetical protein